MDRTIEVINPQYVGKIVSIKTFRKLKGGLTAQAVAHAIKQGKIDYLQLDNCDRMIILTPRTELYKPNESRSRVKKNVTK